MRASPVPVVPCRACHNLAAHPGLPLAAGVNLAFLGEELQGGPDAGSPLVS